MSNSAAQLIQVVAGLMSEASDVEPGNGRPLGEGANEYDRACIEIVTDFLGLPMADSKPHVEMLLRNRQGVR